MVQKRKTIIPISDIIFQGNEVKYVRDAVESTWISSTGPYIDKLETEFATKMDCSHAVSVNNGTSALLLALKSLDIGRGDEVILPSLTFAATVNAVFYAGATPVLVDCLPDHWNIDPAEIEKVITPSTKAIIPVHLYGHPCDMESIMAIAKRNGLFVIEDAAESHTAECSGQKVGSIGSIGCFSFYGNKVITSGEGGMCTTNDSSLAMRMRTLRDHGMSRSKKYWHEEIGFNFRMTNLNAAVGLAQLEQIDQFLSQRTLLSKFYDDRFENLAGARLPMSSPFGKNISWLYCLILNRQSTISRDDLLVGLKEYNIDARPLFFPLHLMSPYRELRKGSDLKNSVEIGLSGINLPLFPSLGQVDIKYIADVVEQLLR
jgi:perosamine synthetase